MGKSTPPSDFKIHVDPSCLTDSTDLDMPQQRITSDQTVVHHDPADEPSVEATREHEDELVEELHHGNEEPHQKHKLLDSRIEAQIQAAARRVVESLERDKYERHNDSVLSGQTDESYDREGTELTYDGTELTYDGTELTYDGTEGTYESEGEEQDEQTNAAFEPESELDAHLESALTAWEPENETNVQEEDSTEWEPSNDHQSDNERGETSSHHDGDIDDDVFSRDSGHSQRSSLNSIHDLQSSDEGHQKRLTSPVLGEDAASSHPADDVISRAPSMASYTPEESNMRTPSKVLHRPPFRTPSSVRAMQMSSPTPSIFSSPRSAKRHLPTVSRIGTPNSQYSPSKRTPTRFKKKEQPLVLLHVTVMPLQWPYAHAVSSSLIPQSLEHVRESWGLLQDKLGDTVLERGILLPHPQDSYEVLEERLLEALELPVRPRAQILKCGHYMGPQDCDDLSSDEENGNTYFQSDSKSDRKWCDICRKDVRLEDTGEVTGKRRFNLKIYASNGLMRAGAWAAAWREMERVDVEIEPWVEIKLRAELENLASITHREVTHEDAEDDFVDEEEHDENAPRDGNEPHNEEHEIDEDVKRRFEEEETIQRIMEEEELQRRAEDDGARRKALDEERMREIYGHESASTQESDFARRKLRQTVDPDSLADLLLAAFKVLMKDKKNIAIGLLSILVLLLALRPQQPATSQISVLPTNDIPEIVSMVTKEAFHTAPLSLATAVHAVEVSAGKVDIPSQPEINLVGQVSEAASDGVNSKEEPIPEIKAAQKTWNSDQEEIVEVEAHITKMKSTTVETTSEMNEDSPAIIAEAVVSPSSDMLKGEGEPTVEAVVSVAENSAEFTSKEFQEELELRG